MNERSRVGRLGLALLLAACEASPPSSGAADAAREELDDAGDLHDARTAPVERDAAEPGIDAANMPDERDATTAPVEDAGTLSDGDSGGAAGDDGGNPAGETMFVSVGGNDNTPWIYTSCDGHAWTRRSVDLPAGHPTDGEGAGLRGVAYGGGTFVITGGGSVSGANVRLLGRSEDGVSWQWEQRPALCTDCQWLGGAAYLENGQGGVWVAGGGTGTRLYSRDGARTWQQSSAQGSGAYRRLHSDGTRAVAAGKDVLSLIELAPAGSMEPVVWHDSAVPSHEFVFVAAGNGAFVALWYDDGCRFLRGSSSWRPCSLPSGADPVLTSVVFGNGKFSILGRGVPIESSDGEHWALAPSGTGTDFRDVTFADGTYATPSLYSSDARSWRPAMPSASNGYAMAAGKLAAGRSCPR